MPSPAAGITALRTWCNGASVNRVADPISSRRSSRRMLPACRAIDEDRERAEHGNFPPRRSPSTRRRPGTAPRSSNDASDALLQHARDDEPHDREAEHDQREQHDQHPARGRDALAALAVQRERVADDCGDAEHVRARARPPTARPTPAASAPLAKSMTSTSRPYFQPRSRATFDAPGLPGALVQDVAALGPGDEGARSGTFRGARRAGARSATAMRTHSASRGALRRPCVAEAWSTIGTHGSRVPTRPCRPQRSHDADLRVPLRQVRRATSRCSSRSPRRRSRSTRPAAGKLAKVLSPAGIVLKGSGFYKTDNRSGSSKGAKSGSEAGNNGDSGSSSGKSDSSKSDSSKSDSSKSDSSKSDSKSTSGSDTKSKSSDAKSA